MSCITEQLRISNSRFRCVRQPINQMMDWCRTSPWNHPSCPHLCPRPWCPRSRPARHTGASRTALSTEGLTFWQSSGRKQQMERNWIQQTRKPLAGGCVSPCSCTSGVPSWISRKGRWGRWRPWAGGRALRSGWRWLCLATAELSCARPTDACSDTAASKHRETRGGGGRFVFFFFRPR